MSTRRMNETEWLRVEFEKDLRRYAQSEVLIPSLVMRIFDLAVSKRTIRKIEQEIRNKEVTQS